MTRTEFARRVQQMMRRHEKLLGRENARVEGGNGVFDRYVNPVLTAEHTPLFWRYTSIRQRTRI
jgi:4-O-beta-D-mannosyl-D-glucose phosphorylase